MSPDGQDGAYLTYFGHTHLSTMRRATPFPRPPPSAGGTTTGTGVSCFESLLRIYHREGAPGRGQWTSE